MLSLSRCRLSQGGHGKLGTTAKLEGDFFWELVFAALHLENEESWKLFVDVTYCKICKLSINIILISAIEVLLLQDGSQQSGILHSPLSI